MKYTQHNLLPRARWLGTAAAFCLTAPLWANAVKGPSSSATPYLDLSNAFSGQSTIYSILTVGDSVNNKPDGTPYRMVGIPDGLGAYDNNNGTFTVLMNHELSANQGGVRAHGDTGAFVSQWVVNKSDFSVLNGQDLIQRVSLWNGSAYTAPIAGPNINFDRFCSADLPEISAFFNAATGLGTQNRLFMNGEEAGNEGRAFAHLVTGPAAGTSYELPRLGKFSWENSLANPASGNRTIVIGTDDSTPGQVYLYAGTKTNTGNDIERAGLTNGTLFGIKANNTPAESRTTGVDAVPNNRDVGTFSLVALGNTETLSGTQLQAASTAAGITEFLRPEDGHWNPLKPNEFFFVTTDRFSDLKETGVGQDGRTRLWKMTFADLDNVSLGGSLEMLLEGGPGPLGSPGQMFDNMTVDSFGNILMQEDPGSNPYLAKIWQFNPTTRELVEVARHTPTFFLPGSPNFLTQDEESSGIIDITSIMGATNGDRWFLFDVQAHYGIPGELVQGGQLLAMRLAPVPEPSTYGLIGAASLLGLVALRRYRRNKAA